MPPSRDRCVNHRSFTRISPTHYLVRDNSSLLLYTIHVGQIADYINFDEQLRTQGYRNLSSIPVAFDDFAYLWNTGARDDDPRRISRVYTPDGADTPTVDLSQHPVLAKEFYITPAQVGLAKVKEEPPKDTFHEEVTKEFLMDVMEQRRSLRQGPSGSSSFRRGNGRFEGTNRRGYFQRKNRFPPLFEAGPDLDVGTPLSRLRFRGKRQHWMRSPSPYHHRASTPEDLEPEGLDQGDEAGGSSHPVDDQPQDQTIGEATLPPSDIPADDTNEVEQMQTN